MPLVYLETVESTSPTRYGFSLEGGKSRSTWLLEHPTEDDIQNAVTDLLGEVTYTAGAGRVQRQPPKADPLFGFLYASQITDIAGIGPFTKTASNDELDVPPMDFWAKYENYLYTVEFTPRPYPVLQDFQISIQTGSWYKDDGTLQSFQYANEWERNTLISVTGQFDALTMQQGNMQFQASGTPGKPGGAQFVGSPKMYLPNSLLKVQWFQVPLRYITSTNSYITGGTSSRGSWVGRINQNAWNGYAAGSLLYLGWSYRQYSPPVQEVNQIYPGVFDVDKLCDIELTFLLTYRQPTALSTAPTNRNYIQAGHNLLPWFITRSFYYAQSVPGTSGPPATPSWKSFPLECLFFDPDVVGGP